MARKQLKKKLNCYIKKKKPLSMYQGAGGIREDFMLEFLLQLVFE
jgi:hypothetical protein